MSKKLIYRMCVILFMLTITGCGAAKNTGTVDTKASPTPITKEENKIPSSTDVASPSPTDAITYDDEEENHQQKSKLLYVMKKGVHNSLPKFKFKLYGKQDDMGTSIKKIVVFSTADENKEIQKIIVRRAKALTTSGDAGGVRIEDVNFDGYNDIMVRCIDGSGPNIRFSFWLWDNKSLKFILNEELNGLISPEILYKKRMIMSVGSCAAGAYYIETYYKFFSGRLTLIKEVDRVYDGKLKHTKVTIKKRINGKMKVVKKYNEEIQ